MVLWMLPYQFRLGLPHFHLPSGFHWNILFGHRCCAILTGFPNHLKPFFSIRSITNSSAFIRCLISSFLTHSRDTLSLLGSPFPLPRVFFCNPHSVSILHCHNIVSLDQRFVYMNFCFSRNILSQKIEFLNILGSVVYLLNIYSMVLKYG